MPAMSESVQKLTKRIEELQGAARKARLEAMQLAAKLLTTSNAELAGAQGAVAWRNEKIAKDAARGLDQHHQQPNAGRSHPADVAGAGTACYFDAS